MATIVTNQLQDNSTLANFIAWAQAISNAFSTFGWTKSTDTGQVNWGTLSTVPGNSAFVYEVWQPGDGLATFYVKVEYGNGTNTNSPTVRFTIAQATNGAGTLTGIVMGPYGTSNGASYTPGGAVNAYECDFAGASGRISAMLWRSAPGLLQHFFSIERSVNSSGAYTSDHVTLIVGGPGFNTFFKQTSLLFGVGVSPQFQGYIAGLSSSWAGLYGVRVTPTQNDVSSAFNGSLVFDTIGPFVGYFDLPCLNVGVSPAADLAEAVTFTATLYGVTRTYLPSKAGVLANCVANTAQNGGKYALCMRWE